MKKAMTLLSAMAFLFVAILAINSVSAAGTGYSVVVGGDVEIWLGASNVSGQWKGGGSFCGTSMSQPKPPPEPGAGIIGRISIMGGGPGTYAYPSFTDPETGEIVPAGKNTFALDGPFTVVYSIVPSYPTGTTFAGRVTFNYIEGSCIQNVVIWIGVAPSVYVPMALIHNALIVINTVG